MDRSKQNAKDTKGLADTFQKLYSELPRELEVMSYPESNQPNVNFRTTQHLNESVSNDNLEVVSFLKKYLPRSDHKEIDGELKKTFALHKQKGGKIKKPQPKRKGKYLTSRERRALNLNRLPRSGGLKVNIYNLLNYLYTYYSQIVIIENDQVLFSVFYLFQYSQYSEVNEMWEDYMRDLLGWKDQKSAPSQEIPQSRTQPNSNKLINVGDEQFRMRICRADYHGALVKITKSNVQSQLGLQVFDNIQKFRFQLVEFTLALKVDIK